MSQCFLLPAFVFVFAVLQTMSPNSYMTYATSQGFTTQDDHNHPRILFLGAQMDSNGNPPYAQVENEQTYEPSFAGLHRSIIGRVPGDVEELANNVPMKKNIQQGQSQNGVFRKEILFRPTSAGTSTPLLFESTPRDQIKESISGDVSDERMSHDSLKRQEGLQGNRLLYFSLAICDQPSWKDQSSGNGPPPPLTVYISLSPDKKNPGPGKYDFSFETKDGWGAKRVGASNDVFFTVKADENPNLEGSYNYELTASTDELYAAYNSHRNFPNNETEDYFVHVESDSTSALFVSSNIMMDSPSTSLPPYSMFVYSKDDPTVVGIQRSFCGLRNHVQIKGNLLNDPSASAVETRLIGLDKGEKRQQFYVTGLNASSEYNAVLAIDGNYTSDGGGVVRGGGTVGEFLSFRTKSGFASLNCHYLAPH